MAKEKRNSAIRVALFSMLGGRVLVLALVNFLQFLRKLHGIITFNMMGMLGITVFAFSVDLEWLWAYLVSKWPKEFQSAKKNGAKTASAFIIVVATLSMIVYRESLQPMSYCRPFGGVCPIRNLLPQPVLLMVPH